MTSIDPGVDPDQTIPYPAPAASAQAAAAPSSSAHAARERRGWLVPAVASAAAICLIGVAVHVLLGDSDEVMRPMQTPAAPPAQPALIQAEAPPPPLVLHQAAPAPEAAPAVPAPAVTDDLEQLVQQQAAQAEQQQAASEPAPEAAAPERVSYQLAIRPSGTVYVDGKRVGATPALKSLELAPGKHRIKVVNPGFPDYVVTLNVKPGKPGTVAHHFAASNLY